MLETDYEFAWFIYGVASLVSIWLVMTGTAWIKQMEIRWFFRVLVFALLFTPVKVDPAMTMLAPAFIAVLLDAVVINTEAGIERLRPLLIAIGVGFSLVLIICQIVRRKRLKS